MSVTMIARPRRIPPTPYGDGVDPLHREGKWVWAPLRRGWLEAKPEELVRQEFIHRLHTQWGFSLDQMAQERRTTHGHGSPRADIVIAADAAALAANRDYRIVVETKAETVTIDPADYAQGESYARAVGAEFLVAHNNKETAFFRLVPGAPGERIQITGMPAASDLGNARRLEEIRRATKAFTRDEFQKLLHDCHSILRDNHKMDPGAAFDEISKILFIKMAFERQGRGEIFTTERLAEVARASLIESDDPAILDRLFTITKNFYRADQLFGEAESLRVSVATFRRIVGLLERFNLSDTGDDVKGIAFEKFLGQTFRGELGQFFTPRPVVEFMIGMLDPREGEIICDPASGTGGFLIRAFEHVRERIERDIQGAKDAARAALEQQAAAEGWPEDKLFDCVDGALARLNRELDLTLPGSRLHHLSRACIFGVDAEARAARTSKMNMIMHGDGHGGIHYHDGLLDTNGIFPDRFDVVVTNPPFGASVGADQIVGATEQTRVLTDERRIEAYRERYGEGWTASHEAMRRAAADNVPILELFDIGRDPIAGPRGTAKVRKARSTETLFVERCLDLLHPGGRMGIVLPDGILNNSSLAWLRDYVIGRARLLAIVSVPHEVFQSAKATVKTSLVFLQRLTVEESEQLARARIEEAVAVDAELAEGRAALAALARRAATGDRADLADLADEIATLEVGGAHGRATLRAKRRLLEDRLLPTDRDVRKTLETEVREARAALVSGREDLVREGVRAALDYPVFMAEVEAAGITGSGETGASVPNELPAVLAAYRRFRQDPEGFASECAALIDAAEEATNTEDGDTGEAV